jgi:hypothetical protein
VLCSEEVWEMVQTAQEDALVVSLLDTADPSQPQGAFVGRYTGSIYLKGIVEPVGLIDITFATTPRPSHQQQ